MSDESGKDSRNIRLERMVPDYSACWRLEDPRFYLVDGKKTLYEIGLPLNLPQSNEPLFPHALADLMATYEKGLGIVRVRAALEEKKYWEKEKKRYDSGRDFWEKETAYFGLELSNRLTQLLCVAGIIKPSEDPIFEKLLDGLKKLPPEANHVRDRVSADVTELYDSIEQIAIFDPTIRGVKALTNQRILFFAERMHVSVNEWGIFVPLNNFYRSLLTDFEKSTLNLTDVQKVRFEKLLYSDIEYDLSLVPWGVITTDQWNWPGFENGSIAASVYFGTDTPSHRDTGDYHRSALSAMWDAARKLTVNCYHKPEVQVPYPPNLQSARRVVIPYEAEGVVKHLGVIFFDDCAAVNPLLLNKATKNFDRLFGCERTVFVGPDSSKRNKVMTPSFASTASFDFSQAVGIRKQLYRMVGFDETRETGPTEFKI